MQADAVQPGAAQVTPSAALPVGLLDTVGWDETRVELVGHPKGYWMPKVHAYVHVPGVASQDVLFVTFKKGKKKLGKPFPCSASHVLPSYKPINSKPGVPVDLALFDCSLPDDYAQSKPGEYTVELSLRKTLQEVDVPLGSLTLTAANIKHGSQNKQTTFQTDVHDSMLGYALVYEKSLGGSGRSYVLANVAESFLRTQQGEPHYDSNALALKVWTKDEGDGRRRRFSVACFHDGQQIGTQARGAVSDTSHSHWTFVGKKGKENVQWSARRFDLINLRVRHPNNKANANNNDNWFYLDQHPGSYECKVLADGQILGVARFEVKDGYVVRTACTDAIQAPNHVVVVPFEDRGMSTAKVDRKLLKAPFYGARKWPKRCPGYSNK